MEVSNSVFHLNSCQKNLKIYSILLIKIHFTPKQSKEDGKMFLLTVKLLLEVSNNTSFRDFGNFISQLQFHVSVVLHDLSGDFLF